MREGLWWLLALGLRHAAARAERGPEAGGHGPGGPSLGLLTDVADRLPSLPLGGPSGPGAEEDEGGGAGGRGTGEGQERGYASDAGASAERALESALRRSGGEEAARAKGALGRLQAWLGGLAR
jgi:hypothetical protein